MSTSYDEDFYAWSIEQAELLRKKQFDKLDHENIAEEIVTGAYEDKRNLERFLRDLLTYLLKWEYQPECRRSGEIWESAILLNRIESSQLLRDNPTLKNHIPLVIAEEYQNARKLAEAETYFHVSTFPDTLPWSLEDILDTNFLPGVAAPEKHIFD